mgnify:CR=1 FL=1
MFYFLKIRQYKLTYIYHALIVGILFFTPSSGAEEAPDLYAISIEELLQVDISIASTQSERIIDTPAIVSRYEADDMAKMGLRTLKDILSFIPGFVLQSTRTGGTSVMIRGLNEGFNQKVLFLLDDVPYWMPAHSDIPLLGIPIESISHVEAIRGPGAVYYGTNASAGVIKVVTKKGAGDVIALATGSNGLVNASTYQHIKLDEKSAISFAIEAQRDEGYFGKFNNVPKQANFPANTPDDGSIIISEEMKSFLARYTREDFNALVQTYSSSSNEHDEPTALNLGTHLEYTGYLFHLDNTWHTDNAEFSIFSDYNKFFLEFEARNLFAVGVDGGFRFGHNGEDNHRWRSGGTVNYILNDAISFFAGLEFERRKIEDYFVYSPASNANVLKLIESNNTNERSIYGQVDYKLGAWRFLLGGRFTDNDQSGEKLTPRASVVYKLDKTQSIKLLYSVGFNSPNFTQLFIQIPNVLQGNPDLKAELVKTVDLSYSYEVNNNLFVVNAYYLEAEDFIQREIQNSAIIFLNSEAFERSGLEIDFQRATYNHSFFANVAYNHQGNKKDNNDLKAHFVPRYTASVGGLYHFNLHHSAGASLRASSKRNEAKEIHRLNLDYQYKRNQIELYIGVRNLLNEEIQTPDVQDFVDAHLIPGGDGINYLAGGKYHF